MKAQPGTLVISLDFELMWGMFDTTTHEKYGDHIAGVHTAIPRLLRLFTHYNIHATWATVGMLTHKDAASLLEYISKIEPKPKYTHQAFSAFHYVTQHLEEIETHPHYYFAPELINAIAARSGQEIASHTYSHYYCLEDQTDQTATLTADFHALKERLTPYVDTPTSIVFPRNQWNDTALTLCARSSITAYRGNEDHFLYATRSQKSQTNLVIRALRLLDHYLNISGHHTYRIQHNKAAKLINIPASRFLRPWNNRLRIFEPLRLRRIKNSMTHAAKHGEIYHLWWHPHNFGIAQDENFTFLTSILNHYKTLEREYGMESKNMKEIATLENESPASFL